MVILKTSHIKKDVDFSEITIAGDSNFISPLMVVKEVLDSKSDKIDEEKGQLKNSKRSLQFRCIWFFAKKFQFEEGWFFENELVNLSKKEQETKETDSDESNNLNKAQKTQGANSNKLNNSDNEQTKQSSDEKVQISLGDKVVFKTNELELSKKKTFLEIEEKKINNKVSSLLSFCSPVFIVTGFSVVEKKEPLIDSQTGRLKRAYCTKMVKLKSFNSNENKYSEFLIPIESIQKIEEVEEKILTIYLESKGGNYLVCRSKKGWTDLEMENNINDILLIDSISTVSGSYRASITNIFSQKKDIISIDNDYFVEKIDYKENLIFPEIVESGGEFNVNSIEERLKSTYSGNTYRVNREIDIDYFNNLKIRKLLKIVYKNKFERITTRYCIPIFMFSVKAKKTNPKDESKEIISTEYYLQSYCLLRSDYRNFKVERIMSMEEISDEKLNTHAYEKWNEYLTEKV